MSSRRRKAVAAAMVAADLPELAEQEARPNGKQTPPPLTNEEKRDLVFGLISGRYFPATQVEDTSLLSMVFMPLAFEALADWDVESIGNIVGDMNKAGPRAINGYPMFMDFRVIGIEDWRDIGERVEKTLAVMNETNPIDDSKEGDS